MNGRSSEELNHQPSRRPLLVSMSKRMDRILSQWSENGSQIEKPLKAVFVAFLVFTILVVTAQNLVTEYHKLLAPHNRVADAAKNLLLEHKKLGSGVLMQVADVISEDERFRKAVLAGNIEEITAITDRVFMRWAKDASISEFTIYTPNHEFRYRDNGIALKSNPNVAFLSDLSSAMYRTTNSLEFGNNDEIVVSLFQPWFHGGRLLGYFKLAAEIETPLALAGTAVNAEVVKVYGTQSPISGETSALPGEVSTSKLRYKTLGQIQASPAALENILNNRSFSGKISPFYIDGNKILFSQELSNKIINGSDDAKLVLIRDVTKNVLAFAKYTLISLLAAIGLAMLAWLVFRRLLGNLQYAVKATRSRLEHEVDSNTKELEISRAKLIEAQKIASVGSWERDIATNEVRASEEFFRIMGIPSETPPEKIQEHLFARVPPKEFALAKRQIEPAIATCGEFDFEHSVKLLDGSIVFVHIRGFVMPDAAGNPARVVGTVHDITARQKAEHQNNLLASILSTSLNEIYVLNADTFAIEYANTCAQRNLGYTLDELKSQKIWDINSVYRREAVERHVAPLLGGKVSCLSLETSHRRSDGSEYPVDLQVQIMKDRGRNLFV
ncbi:MAG: PAS domain S-box protein, partial [Hyphomicrobiales bacterium]